MSLETDGSSEFEFSDEALALRRDASQWIARHRLLVRIGITAVTIGMCSMGSAIVNFVSHDYIPDIRPSYLPNSIFIGSHSSCNTDERFPDGPPVMRDHGGITARITPWGIQIYHHAPIELFCQPAGGIYR